MTILERINKYQDEIKQSVILGYGVGITVDTLTTAEKRALDDAGFTYTETIEDKWLVTVVKPKE